MWYCLCDRCVCVSVQARANATWKAEKEVKRLVMGRTIFPSTNSYMVHSVGTGTIGVCTVCQCVHVMCCCCWWCWWCVCVSVCAMCAPVCARSNAIWKAEKEGRRLVHIAPRGDRHGRCVRTCMWLWLWLQLRFAPLPATAYSVCVLTRLHPRGVGNPFLSASRPQPQTCTKSTRTSHKSIRA